MKNLVLALVLCSPLLACGGPSSDSADAFADDIKQACTVAADCHGTVPHTCKAGQSCAHYACDTSQGQGLCVVSYGQKEGAECGGSMTNAKRCDAGLECQANAHNPDAAGSCVQAAPGCVKASDCTGLLPTTCRVGGGCAHFACDTASGAGRCLVSYDRREGESCGGFVGDALKCDPGLVCKAAQSHPDAPGVCSR